MLMSWLNVCALWNIRDRSVMCVGSTEGTFNVPTGIVKVYVPTALSNCSTSMSLVPVGAVQGVLINTLVAIDFTMYLSTTPSVSGMVAR